MLSIESYKSGGTDMVKASIYATAYTNIKQGPVSLFS